MSGIKDGESPPDTALQTLRGIFNLAVVCASSGAAATICDPCASDCFDRCAVRI